MDTPNNGLLPASCIFAGELMHAAEAEIGFTTPFGIFSPKIFLIGTLTEKIQRDGKVSSLRISDPTGVFSCSMSWQNTPLLKTADEIEAPSFVAVFGTVRFRKYAGRTFLEIVPETITPSTREARDAWILSTAESAISRLEKSPASDLRKELAGRINAALSSVRPAGQKEDITNEKILEIISVLSEKKGARILDVISRLKSLGLDDQSAKMRLSMLMEEGECYTPTTEFIKIA
jgi:RPA family protein